MTSRTEALTAHFYDWEQRGRGWFVFDRAIDLEPPFQPFHHLSFAETTYIDDGRKPSLLEAPFHAIGKLFSFSKNKPTVLPEQEIKALPFQSKNIPLQSFVIVFPKETKIRAEPMQQLLIVLSNCAHPVSFEIVAQSESIYIQIVSRSPETLFIKSQVKAFFPECILEDNSELNILGENKYISIIDLGLKNEFMCPITECEDITLDPLTGIFGMLEQLEGNNKAAVQILFQGVSYPWTQSILASVSDNRGACFFDDFPEMLPLAKEKTASPLYAVVIRAIGESESPEYATSIAEGVARMLQQTSQSPFNSLVPLKQYQAETHQYDVLLRQSHRLGMILNAKELLTFVHFPSQSIVSKKLLRDTKKTKPAPLVNSNENAFVLGINIHQGKETEVTVSAEQRLKHTHIIGATGTGKSTLLLNLIVQDIQNQNGVAVLDPHGDLIEHILPHIPKERINDVILIDPSDINFPVGFNILTAHSEIEKEVLSSDLVSVFRRLSTSWGDQMNSVLANAILAFLESGKGGTLMDLRRFLVEKDFREQHLKNVTDPHIVYYWQKEYPLLKSASIGPILTRLDTFLRPKPIRYMAAQKKGLDFEKILDTQKILLIKLSQGLIGDENSYILGTTFVSKMYQAAMARQAKAKEARSDFFVYVDEFQNFITPSMSAILSGARKYHLGLILAHQDMQQLVKFDSELASSVTSNAGTRICFRLGDTDAKRFESGFSYFDETDLQNLSTGEAIARIERTENDFNLRIEPIQNIEQDEAEKTKREVIHASQKNYGTARSEVEQTLEYAVRATETHITQTEKIKDEELKTEKEKIEEVKSEIEIQQTQKLPELDEEQKAKTKERLVQQKAISQHRYLQTLIKKMAETRGFTAKIEEPTPDGEGRVDVLLERNGKRIACEIGVTTTKQWELHNIEKCLSAGYETVVAIASDTKAKQLMQKQVNEQLSKAHSERVLVMEADSLFQYLDAEITKEATTEKRMKGYRVKVEYENVSGEEMQRKKELVTRVVLEKFKK